MEVKFGPRHNYHKGQVAISYYDNQPTRPLWLLRQRPNFTSTYCEVNACLAYCLCSVLNEKEVVGAFNQERALVFLYNFAD